MAWVSESPLVAEALAVVAREARDRGIRFEVELVEAAVLGRSLDLARMLRNLVENAVAHSPDGGSIELRAVQDGDLVRISVRDFGSGVSVEDAGRIFQPFFRGGHERASGRPGTGLGLAIASEIVRQHANGSLELVAVDGPGACFVATLPAAKMAPARA